MNIHTLSSSIYKPSAQKPVPLRQAKQTAKFGASSVASPTSGNEPKPPASKWQKGLNGVKAGLPYNIVGAVLCTIVCAIFMPPALIFLPLALLSFMAKDFRDGTKDPD